MIDKAEIYALKKTLGLPKTTPTAGIVVTTGVLFASIRVEIKQLLYLYEVLTKEPKHWTQITLMVLKEQNHGWAKRLMSFWSGGGLNVTGQQSKRSQNINGNEKFKVRRKS